MATSDLQISSSTPARVWADAASETASVTPTLTQAKQSLTVTTAFRTVEIPLPADGDVALAVATAKLIVMTDLMRVTPEEREERIEKETRQQEIRQELERAEEQLEALIAAQATQKLTLEAFTAKADETLNALDGQAVRAVLVSVSKTSDSAQARSLAEAWLNEEETAEATLRPAEQLRALTEAVTDGWRYPDNEIRIDG